MTLTTIHQAANDPELTNRITASVWEQVTANPTFGDSTFGRMVLTGGGPILAVFAYPVAVDYQSEYEFAVGNGNPSPGGDPSVITDANIEASVQTHWPWSGDETPPVSS